MRIKEGRRIKSIIPMDKISPFIMANRSGASNTFYATVDVDKCEQLIREKRAEGMSGLGMIHIFMSAYVRVISQLPGLNRFIRGQRVYSRNNIEICMTIKKHLALNEPEAVVKLELTPYDTLYSIYNRLSAELEENRKDGDHNATDTASRILTNFPSVFLKFTVWLLKLMDYFGMLPRALTKLSPFHASMYITNMGSLGIPPVYHHLYDFGNLPIFIAMGKKRSEYVVNKNGETEKHRVIDFTIVCDERICDGHYYATAFKKFKRILANPEQLLSAPEKVISDIA